MKLATIILSVFFVLSLGVAGYEGHLINSMKKTAAATLASTTAQINALETELAQTKATLQSATDQNTLLASDLKAEQDRNNAFQGQIDSIDSTVGSLDKLSKMDPELLKKYSKVSFLNENYMPAKLVQLDKQYLYDESVPKFMEAHVEPFFADMIAAAQSAGVKLWVVSAFRSFDEQKGLKSQYSVVYGTGANAFSADQGYSEHQLGTAVDFTAESLSGGLTGFDGTAAYTWLTDNAYRYGFVLSYPKNNSYYIFEPWHWRFVGHKLATYLHNHNEYFYDLDQRTIDSYLISLFD